MTRAGHIVTEPPPTPPPMPPSTPGGPVGPHRGKPSPTFGDLFWLGTAVAISVIGGGAIGYGLDAALGTSPWLSFAGLAFGIVSAVLLAFAQIRKFL